MAIRFQASSIAALVLSLAASPAAAQGRATASMRIDANVLNNCTVQAQPLAFGMVPVVNLTPLETTARVVVKCGPNIPFTIALDNGQHFAAQRRVHNAGLNAYLAYEVHSDPARTSPWGSGAGQTVSGNSGASGEATLIAYGRITAALLVFAGPYTDSITVTVSFRRPGTSACRGGARLVTAAL